MNHYNAGRQHAVNAAAEHYGAGTGTAAYYGVPGNAMLKSWCPKSRKRWPQDVYTSTLSLKVWIPDTRTDMDTDTDTVTVTEVMVDLVDTDTVTVRAVTAMVATDTVVTDMATDIEHLFVNIQIR